MLKISRNLFTPVLLVAFLLASCASEGEMGDEVTKQDDKDQTDDDPNDDQNNGDDQDDNDDDNDDNGDGDRIDISILVDKFYNDDALVISVGDEFITIESANQPDHKSMYYDESNDLYEDYDEPNNPDFKKNPNSIEMQDHVYKIPRYPTEATNKETTPMGPMGVAVNSVAFFNQQAAPGDDILEELNTFDQYEGHPAQGGDYHYHIEPIWLTEDELDKESFLGLLLDGFPVYGPEENGQTVTNDDLDDYHGHVSATAEFPDGIYHYHITEDLPWINGDGFYGEPGTITQ
ncbi:YHYH protein [Marinoscillum sp.]|uniref:YHYH protein n=1 Tax=Marinoscillum sp. TaxID=2024838 RepID=UPI003BAC96F0